MNKTNNYFTTEEPNSALRSNSIQSISKQKLPNQILIRTLPYIIKSDQKSQKKHIQS